MVVISFFSFGDIVVAVWVPYDGIFVISLVSWVSTDIKTTLFAANYRRGCVFVGWPVYLFFSYSGILPWLFESF